jgi:indolepyruvate ferredoxin oxidoreductase beta subunit
MPVIIGAMEYPTAALENLKAKGVDIDDIDALAPALEAGSAKATNIVLMGRLSKYMDIAPEKWEEAIRQSVAEKFVEMNLKAFALGRK